MVLTFHLKLGLLCTSSTSCRTEARSEIKICRMPQRDEEGRAGAGQQLLILDKCEMPTVAFHAFLGDFVKALCLCVSLDPIHSNAFSFESALFFSPC